MYDYNALKMRLAAMPPRLIEEEECRQAGVCMTLIQGEGGPEFLFEVRSSKLDDQPGDISFPGGMLEAGEEPPQAACRELQEELLITAEDYELLGAGALMHTGNLLLHPFVVMLKNYNGSFNTDEVSEIFTVPVSFFKEHKPEMYKIELDIHEPENFPFERIYGGRKYGWRKRTETVYFYDDYEGHCIWGITAKLICKSGVLKLV